MSMPALNWSDPTPCTTETGRPAVRRTAPATDAFWTIYRTNKADLLKSGYRVRKNDATGQWSVIHVAPAVDAEAKVAAAIEASHATDADAAAIKAPPAGLAYLPYQRAGIRFGADRRSVLIGDEMGLGKTIQAIGIANETGARRILVICPASLRWNWERELRKWLLAPLKITVLEPKTAYPEGAEVVIINYDILDRHENALRALPWDLMIVDEAHYCKNAKTKRARQIFGHRPRTGQGREIKPIPAARRVLMTGTPIANRPVELFPLISFLDPAGWPNFFRFAMRYCAAHKTRFGWDFTGSSHLDELQQRLRSTIMIRRLKKDVLTDLPAKVRQVIALGADSAEARAALADERAAIAEAEAAVEAAQLAVELAKADDDAEAYERAVTSLRKASGIAFERMAVVRHQVALAKVPAVLEHIENAEGSKIVIFAHHKDVVRALEAGLAPSGKVVKIVGDTPMSERQAAVDAFQNDAAVRYFIGSIGAAGVGITLTASSHVIFAELDWVPGNVSQAEDRCHRIGQRDSVLVQHIVLDGSLDATIAQRLVDKQAVIDAALDGKTEATAAQPQPAFDWSAATAAAREAEAARIAAREATRANMLPVRREPATADVRREQLDAEAAELADHLVPLIHAGLRQLAGCDLDRAQQLNDIGFNRLDGRIGHALAEAEVLTKRQAALGRRILRKYRRQLGGLHESIFS